MGIHGVYGLALDALAVTLLYFAALTEVADAYLEAELAGLFPSWVLSRESE
jgi:hypothetical protein